MPMALSAHSRRVIGRFLQAQAGLSVQCYRTELNPGQAIFLMMCTRSIMPVVRSDQITEPTPNSSLLISFGSLRSPPCLVPSAHLIGAASRRSLQLYVLSLPLMSSSIVKTIIQGGPLLGGRSKGRNRATRHAPSADACVGSWAAVRRCPRLVSSTTHSGYSTCCRSRPFGAKSGPTAISRAAPIELSIWRPG